MDSIPNRVHWRRIFKYLKVLKLVSSRLDRLSVVVISPARDPSDSNSLLTQLFGAQVPIKSAGVRLPQNGWHVRFSTAVAREPRYVSRAADFAGSQVCHADVPVVRLLLWLPTKRFDEV